LARSLITETVTKKKKRQSDDPAAKTSQKKKKKNQKKKQKNLRENAQHIAMTNPSPISAVMGVMPAGNMTWTGLKSVGSDPATPNVESVLIPHIQSSELIVMASEC
jgi:hypothetical protein